MQLQINSSESAMTEAVETQIREQVKALEDYVNGLTGCTRCLEHLRFIVIAKAGRVRIHLDVPGRDLTIDRQNSDDLSAAMTRLSRRPVSSSRNTFTGCATTWKSRDVLPTFASPRFFRRTVMAFSKLSTGEKSTFAAAALKLEAWYRRGNS